jgi:hypothetical protein
MFNFDKTYPHAFTPYKNHHKFFIFQNFPYDTQHIKYNGLYKKHKAQENPVVDFMKNIKPRKKWLWTLQKA